MGAKKSIESKPKTRLIYIVNSQCRLRQVGMTTRNVNRRLKVTDDSTIVGGSGSLHLHSIVFYYDQYLYGFVVNYQVDGKIHTQKHLPVKHPKSIPHKVHFADDEFIIEISATWSKTAYHSISGRTNYGNKFSAECFEGYGVYSHTEKLYKKHGEVVCGLKSFIDEGLQGLSVIGAKLAADSLRLIKDNFTAQTLSNSSSSENEFDEDAENSQSDANHTNQEK